ncbi:MAG: DUF1553 domain-containing protein [Planctomycetaceae bacterium]|nr:DUF1553 domain-containing protein [Planctomycetaceae bacterium]
MRRRLGPFCLIIATWLAITGPVGAEDAEATPVQLSADEVEFFEAKIRPVLIEHCYRCHSAEGEGVKGGLRLDHAQGWKVGGDSGPAVLPGKPDESLLIESIRYASYEMPPDGQLPASVIADFETWVRMGAPDPRTDAPALDKGPRAVDIAAGREFWSFRPLAPGKTPDVQDANWPQTWIDRFILAGLEAVSLAPSPDQDAARLLRRLSYDLTGLPPSVEELHEFQQAARSDLQSAVVAAVDRRLQSPEFGEHWGRHWLDVARYADSNGGDFNATFHDAWRYRDYVIRTFNEDKPFDQFVREQIAGDLLPYTTDAEREEQLVATGFLMIGPKMLSERDKDKLRMDIVDEQVSTVGGAFLGMTLGCARCHDHKFDPIPTHDYYALAGIFRNTQTLDGESQKYVSDFCRVPLPIEADHAAALETHQKLLKSIDKRLATAKKQLEELKALATSTRTLGVLVDDIDAMKVGDWKASTHVNRFVGQGYVHDDKQAKGEKSITYTPDLPQTGEYEVRFAFTASSGRDRKVPVHIHHSSGETVIYLDQTKEPPIEKLFVPLGRFAFEAGTGGHVTVSTAGTTEYVIADAMQFIPVDELEQPQTEGLAADQQAERQQLEADIKQLESQQADAKKSAPPPAPQAIAVREEEAIGDYCVCIRGEHNRLGSEVPRGFLQVALFDEPPALSEAESGRRELADWIADPRNPLAARVFVNRVWAWLLGEGIVRTVDNFGTLGDSPSHPELLDRLAHEFVAHNWSVKHLVREIVLSRAYWQDSRHRTDGFAADPENRLLWRTNRKRLPAESLRDSMLLMSERLDAARGGNPVAGLGVLVTQNRADDQGYERGESTQRSVYMPIIRNELPTMLSAFDFADPDFVTGRRTETNVPAQALLLLNSPFVKAVARSTAERLLEEGSGDNAGRVIHAYELILSRTPSGTEIDRALEFLETLGVEGGEEDGQAVAAWATLLHALYASTDFRLLD